MSDAMKSSLSAFIDGETSAEESAQVVQRLIEDEDLQSEWKNYHAMASVLRNEDVSSMQSPMDWDALAAELPENGDILQFQPRNRFKSMLVHGGIGAGIAACIMVAVFLILSDPPTESDSSLAIGTPNDGGTLEAIPIKDPPLQPLSFNESFSITVSPISPDIREELRQMTLEALHAYDISRSGISGSVMPAASVVSRKVSEER